MAVGGKLRELRKGRSLTLQELADKLDYSRDYIWKIETGRSRPSFTFLEAAARFFDVDMRTFFDDGETLPSGDAQEDASEVVKFDMPLPPIGWDELSEEDRRTVRDASRRFEEQFIQDLIRRRRKEGRG